MLYSRSKRKGRGVLHTSSGTSKSIMEERNMAHIHIHCRLSLCLGLMERERQTFRQMSGRPLVNSFFGHCLWYMSKDNIQRQWQRHITKTKTKTTYKDKDKDKYISPDVWPSLGQFFLRTLSHIHMRHWQLIRSKLGFYFSSGITLDIDVIFLLRTFY